jgi:hypothetical protein
MVRTLKILIFPVRFPARSGARIDHVSRFQYDDYRLISTRIRPTLVAVAARHFT